METKPPPVLTVGETIRRTKTGHGLLVGKVETASPEELVQPYLIDGEPMGDFCDSLKDLVAHVLMWDEINLGVLAEARRGRSHWILDSRWEQPDTGLMLSRFGVAASRKLPIELLSHRHASVHEALTDELAQYDEETWLAPLSLLLDAAAPTPGVGRATTVVVSAVEGMGGIGKTQLALRAAHELVRAGRYGDVQLFSNLRGFAPDQLPADPGEVLEAFLRQLEVPVQVWRRSCPDLTVANRMPTRVLIAALHSAVRLVRPAGALAKQDSVVHCCLGHRGCAVEHKDLLDGQCPTDEAFAVVEDAAFGKGHDDAGGEK